MNEWIDAWLTPSLWLLGIWSLKWAILIAGLAAYLYVRTPKVAAMRLLWARCVLVAGLVIPLVPNFWGNAMLGELAIGNGPQPKAVSVPQLSNATAVKTVGRSAAILPTDAATRELPSVKSTTMAAPIAIAVSESPQGMGWRRAGVIALALIWTIGFVALVARLIFGWFTVQRLRRSAVTIGDPFQAECADCRQQLGVRRKVGLAAHASVDIPIFVGGRRPLILVPSNWNALPEISRRAILFHELTHAKRRDDYAKLAEEFVRAVFFFHPLVVWLLTAIDAAREEVCDAAVVNRGIAPRELARILLNFCRSAGTQRLGYGLHNQLSFFRARTVKRRIHLLTEEQEMSRWTLRLSRLAICGVLGCGIVLAAVVGGFGVRAEEPVVIPVAAASAPTAKPTSQLVAIIGTCVGENHKPIANVHVQLFRIDHSDKSFLLARGRLKVTVTGTQSEDANQPSQLSYGGGYGDPEKQRLLRETRTDGEGKFQFADQPVDEGWRSQQDVLNVVVRAEGRESKIEGLTIREGSDGKRSVEPLNLTLQKSASLRGRITNAEGQPVAGAVVSSSDFNYLAKPMPGILCAVTDADGRYEISDMPPLDVDDFPPMVIPLGTVSQASFVLMVEHADYAPGIIEYTKVPSTIDHVLQWPAMLRGQVVLDESGKPGEKVYVRWTHELGFEGSIKTDAEGNYSIPRLLPGKFTIKAQCEGWLVNTQETQLVSGDNRLDFRLRSGGFIKGHVVDDATGEVPQFDRSVGAQLYAYLEGQDPVKGCYGWVNEDGSFSMSVEPGNNLIHFPNPDWKLNDTERWNKQGVDVAKGQTVEIELRLAPRVGGWASLIAEGRAATAKAKGGPIPPLQPTPPAAPKYKLKYSGASEDEYDPEAAAYLNWPDELVPKKPMSENALLRMLDELVGTVERKTIDGEEYVTSIALGESESMSNSATIGQVFWMEYSLLAHIDKFPRLESVWLVGIPAEDKYFEPLRGHEKLQSLALGWTKNLTVAGVKHLATLPNLKMLGMFGFKLDDAALAEINHFPKLEVLQFGGVITDAGVANLKGNSKLKVLGIITLGDTKISDESLIQAATMPNLEQLAFMSMSGEIRFSDDGLKYLAGMTKLKSLAISGKQITDAGLIHLSGLKNLNDLNVEGTSVTQKGIDDLKVQLPDLKVTGNELEKPREFGVAK